MRAERLPGRRAPAGSPGRLFPTGSARVRASAEPRPVCPVPSPHHHHPPRARAAGRLCSPSALSSGPLGRGRGRGRGRGLGQQRAPAAVGGPGGGRGPGRPPAPLLPWPAAAPALRAAPVPGRGQRRRLRPCRSPSPWGREAVTDVRSSCGAACRRAGRVSPQPVRVTGASGNGVEVGARCVAARK